MGLYDKIKNAEKLFEETLIMIVSSNNFLVRGLNPGRMSDERTLTPYGMMVAS